MLFRSGKFVAEAGAAKGNRKVVAYQPSAEAGEDGRAVGEARAVLLADAGGRAPDARAVRSNVATDRDVAASGELRTDREASKSNRGGERRRKECLRNRRGTISITRSSPGRRGIAPFFDWNSSFALAIRLKSRMIRANQD